MSVLDIRFLHPLSLPEIVGVCFFLFSVGGMGQHLPDRGQAVRHRLDRRDFVTIAAPCNRRPVTARNTLDGSPRCV